MKERRDKWTSFRTSESYKTAIAILKKQYQGDSESDIVHKALAQYIRTRFNDWNTDLQKLCDRLEYGFDTDTKPKK